MATVQHPEKKPVAVWAVTQNGARLAVKIAAALDGICFVKQEHAGNLENVRKFHRLVPAVRGVFADFSGHVFVTAAGIAIRTVAPLIADKTVDPAVVAVDESGRFCVSLLSGHLGGANELAEKAALAVGAVPVITTATDSRGILAVDVLARRLDLAVENPTAIKAVNMALLEGGGLRIHDPFRLVSAHLPLAPEGDGPPDVFVDDAVRPPDPDPMPLILRPKTLVAGMGCNRGTSAEEMRGLLQSVMAAANVSPLSLSCIATIDIKKDEPGLSDLARSLNIPLIFFSKQDLAEVSWVPNPSAMAQKHVGVKSVCEAAAILAAKKGKLIHPKKKSQNATAALARRSFT